jgi:hypothetical protein
MASEPRAWAEIEAVTLRHANACDWIVDEIGGARERLVERRDHVEHVTSSSEASAEYRQALGEAIDLVGELGVAVAAAAHAMRSYLRAAEPAAAAPAATSGSTRLAPGAVGPPSSGSTAPITARWRRADDVPPWVRTAARDFKDRPYGDGRLTRGVFQGKQIVSGRDRHLASDLDHDPLPAPPDTFYGHVESQVAAAMRSHDLRHGEVVLDNTPCGTRERDRDFPWVCEKILPSILPRGSTLTIWATRDSGRTWWRGDYTGTGERISR